MNWPVARALDRIAAQEAADYLRNLADQQPVHRKPPRTPAASQEDTRDQR